MISIWIITRGYGMANITKVVVCGQKQLCINCLEILKKRKDTEICAIVASLDDWEADVPEWAAKNKIKCYIGNINRFQPEIKLLDVDVIFSFQARELFKEDILFNTSKRGCINLHMGLLDSAGGCYPISNALLYSDKAGVTLHEMNEEFDKGAVLATAETDVLEKFSENIWRFKYASNLYVELTELATDLFEKEISMITQHDNLMRRFNLENYKYYDKDSIDFEKDSVLDIHSNASCFYRRASAFMFEPFQKPTTVINGLEFIIDDYLVKDGKLSIQLTETGEKHD